MSAQARTIQEVAHDALEDLESAQIVLRKVEAVLYAALADKCTSQHVRNLVDVAWNLAADGANTADCNREQIAAALAGCAALGAGGNQ
ncbi:MULTISPECIES: hypothetical protein [Pseudomonas]|uniref:hypothetical protein n=1 Tax=Pseudomonas TaxID=286 RepID=UPI0016446B42|nr:MULTISPECIES: hypothetical protein [Pseudomonas]MBC3244717.1 hypothetical protein [Pseudomonas lurida]MDO4235545.1 hypothetical protein [Pseudomonas sp.]